MAKNAFSRVAQGAGPVLLAALSLTGCNIDNGTGNYVGVVSRFQTDGIFDVCKTWEGEIASVNIRGARSGTGGGNTMHFTVLDKDVASQIEDAMLKQQPIRAEFSHTVNPWPCRQASDDIITKVIPMDVALNSPLGGGHVVEGEEGAAPVVMRHAGERVFICKEAETGGSAPAAAVPQTAPPAKEKDRLPDILRMK